MREIIKSLPLGNLVGIWFCIFLLGAGLVIFLNNIGLNTKLFFLFGYLLHISTAITIIVAIWVGKVK